MLTKTKFVIHITYTDGGNERVSYDSQEIAEVVYQRVQSDWRDKRSFTKLNKGCLLIGLLGIKSIGINWETKTC